MSRGADLKLLPACSTDDRCFVAASGSIVHPYPVCSCRRPRRPGTRKKVGVCKAASKTWWFPLSLQITSQSDYLLLLLMAVSRALGELAASGSQFSTIRTRASSLKVGECQQFI